MNYASLDEIYSNQTQQPVSHRENSYDAIIKNLLQQQQETTSSHIPVPTSDSQFTTYKKVSDFSNRLDTEISPKKLEEKIERFESTPAKEIISIDIDDEEVGCLKFLDHISKCEKCREFIAKKFNLTPKTTEDKKREDMLDVAIYILTGVFVLFLLDSFMNLGKYLKR